MILEVAGLIDRRISQFLLAWRTVPPLGKWESEIEAMNLLILVVRNIEAITELAKTDLVLVPAANVLARAVFEIAVKAAWMITPIDPFEREVRWLAHLAEEERMQENIANKVTRFGGDPTHFQNHRASLQSFRTGVVRSLPSGYAVPGNPNVEQMLESIGQNKVYSVYSMLAAYVHGSHSATWLYRRNLGTLKEYGEFIDASSWYISLWTSWKSLQVLGAYILERLKATHLDFTDVDLDIESTLSHLSNEKTSKES